MNLLPTGLGLAMPGFSHRAEAGDNVISTKEKILIPVHGQETVWAMCYKTGLN